MPVSMASPRAELAPPDGAEVARAQEGDHFVEFARPVQRLEETKARELQLLRRLLEASVGEVELVRRDRKRRGLAALDYEDLHRLFVDEARGKELDAKRALAVAPQRGIRPRPQGAVLIVGEAAHIAFD